MVIIDIIFQVLMREKKFSQDVENFFQNENKLIRKGVTSKQINSSTFKTQTSLWRKKQVFENKNKQIVSKTN